MISIHASAKEATWCPPFFWPLVHFNPRLREGGDAFTACIPIFSQEYFNPRLREGGDPNNQTKKADGTISIHASAKEATNFCFSLNAIDGISIHASAKEATLFFCSAVMPCKISIHASAKEATATYCDTSAIMYISSLNNFFIHYF